jgi:rubrerythrin
MYAEFIEMAKRVKATVATRSFPFAPEVEAVHAVLYQDALDNLGRLTGWQHTYYVCPDCGNTLTGLSILKCLICRNHKAGFIAVSRSGAGERQNVDWRITHLTTLVPLRLRLR